MSDDEKSGSDSGSGSEDIETTGLIATRAKRATAGNLYASLRANLDDEEFQKELLAEDADDIEDYEGSDREDDEDAFDSSSDEEDAGPPKDGEAEDLTGEKEIKRAERAEAGKKRKAKDARLKVPVWQKKKVKLADDVKTEDGASERPKKKSERDNWMPTPADAPIRQSGRALARANREITHANLKQSFARSEKQRRVMKTASEREKRTKRVDLTLEERLQKAAKVEKETKREFNKWEVEEAERQRIRDEQLAAKRRKVMDGPFVRYWSGSAMWEGDTMKTNRVLSERERLSRDEDMQQAVEDAEAEKTKEGVEATAAEPPQDTAMKDVAIEPWPNEADKSQEGQGMNVETSVVKGVAEKETIDDNMALPAATTESTMLGVGQPALGVPMTTEESHQSTAPMDEKLQAAVTHSHPTLEVQSQSSGPWLQGIEEYASLSTETPNTPSNQTAIPNSPPFYKPSAPYIHAAWANESQESQPFIHNLPHDPHLPHNATTTLSGQTPPPPPLPEQAQRCLIMLEQFPNLAATATASKRGARASMILEPKDVATILLPDSYPSFTPEQAKYVTAKALKKRGGDVPPKQRCAVTSWIAKYRDPMTQLAYADMHAYKMIQRVLTGGCQWSSLLGAWVGPTYGPIGRPAQGVPDGFLSLTDVKLPVEEKLTAEEQPVVGENTTIKTEVESKTETAAKEDFTKSERAGQPVEPPTQIAS